MQISYQNDLSELARLAADLEAFCQQQGLGDGIAHAFNLCLDELMTNIINYGFEDGGPHQIHLEMERKGDEVVATLRDSGKAFNPLNDAAEPDLQADLEDREIGGLGVFFVKQMMDAIDYRRDGNQNVLTLKKRIGK